MICRWAKWKPLIAVWTMMCVCFSISMTVSMPFFSFLFFPPSSFFSFSLSLLFHSSLQSSLLLSLKRFTVSLLGFSLPPLSSLSSLSFSNNYSSVQMNFYWNESMENFYNDFFFLFSFFLTFLLFSFSPSLFNSFPPLFGMIEKHTEDSGMKFFIMSLENLILQ